MFLWLEYFLAVSLKVPNSNYLFACQCCFFIAYFLLQSFLSFVSLFLIRTINVYVCEFRYLDIFMKTKKIEVKSFFRI